MTNIIRRFKERRHDKLKLWIGMLVGAALPLLVCWVVPNLWANRRERIKVQEAQAAQAAEDAFITEYADQIALCDREDDIVDESAQMPADLRVVVIQYKKAAVIQDNLPEAWQPQSSDDVTVVVCLAREKIQFVGSCEDGEVPDLSAYEGYELATVAAVRNVPNLILPGACYHPEATGMALYRYATVVRVYGAAGGQLIARTMLWGGEPGICLYPDANMSAQDALYGSRITAAALLDGVVEILGS